MPGDTPQPDRPGHGDRDRVRLATVAREWGRVGLVAFGGPPAHVSLLRELCVRRRGWLDRQDFEDAFAATNLLPGPSSTQLALLCAWRVRGTPGALVGGTCFLLPGLVLILALAALFLAGDPPRWVGGVAAGAGAAVAAVAVHAGVRLAPDSVARVSGRGPRLRWAGYAGAGATATVFLGPWLVLVLLGAGLMEVAVRALQRTVPEPPAATEPRPGTRRLWLLLATAPAVAAAAGLTALTWVAFKVGALSYGGGFVIVPLMHDDAVGNGWMTDGEFLGAVALGQVTPGPVVLTVAVVGFAAAGLGGGLVATAVAFGPSFALVVLGGQHFERLRGMPPVQAFFLGAGPAVVGAICGSALPLALGLQHAWQYAVLGLAACWLLVLRRGVVSALLTAAGLGLFATLAGLPVG